MMQLIYLSIYIDKKIDVAKHNLVVSLSVNIL